MQLGKKENPIDQHFEDMPEQELFLKIRDDLLHSRTGINLEEQLSGDDPGKLISEMNSYIARMYRISEEKIKRFDAYIENYIFAFQIAVCGICIGGFYFFNLRHHNSSPLS